MTLAERVEAFKVAFPENRAAWPWLVQEQGRDVLYPVWVCGNDFRNETRYYGAHPRGYLEKLLALFPDVTSVAHDVATSPILHAFAGSLRAGPWVRLDARANLVDGVVPDVIGSVYQAGSLFAGRRFALVTADPPYSDADAMRYGTPMVDRLRATEALADVASPGGYLAWLDTCWPQHSKTHWVTVGRAFIQRSTNHRFRGMTLFERTANWEG